MPIGSASDTIRKFNAVAQANEETLKKNPYSESYKIQQFDSRNYGRPPPGSKTEARGIKAGVHVCREILFLCETIDSNAEGEEPHKWVKFGKLFNIYSFYSDKVRDYLILVGMLIRARKYGLVHFEGEMLYQRQDDEKLITMLMSLQEIRESLTASGDPANCIQIRRNSAPIAFVPPETKEKPKLRPIRSDSVTSSKSKFESSAPPSTLEEDSHSVQGKPKKPWTPKDSSKAPVFCTY
ncbi:CRE-TAG-243 protein [Caenorhabditis remanei]|uniref:CRE-TAG-243 protein n=1 Tax=Caenorhabditis remanei TaxID=31234 RepID=E3MCU9_CAERE|nr:CRE-TAG-243 protein [Caenorhabditis remanei]